MTDAQPIVLIDLGVGGMTCDDCVVRVKSALEAVPGVEAAAVDLASRSAVVRARADVPGTQLAAAVREAGPPAGHRYNAFERGRRPVESLTGSSEPTEGGR
ncbi:MAG TPA: heavy metal-associated domain-containing protein [Candidatus Binatia bacterium]|nr:heavy metal-associated domain-containing protein [Candidatus Binatia bacterium]